MVSVDIRLNENFHLVFFFCCYTQVKSKFFNNGVVSFVDDIEKSSSQLKRFNESVIDPKCLLKIEAISFCFNNILSFSSIFLVQCYFSLRSTVYMLTFKQAFLSAISSLHGKYQSTKMNRLLRKDSSNFVSAIYKISIFPSILLTKSPNLFLMELISRYEKITLLRCECSKHLKVKLIFFSYSGLVVDASIKEALFICSAYFVLYQTFFKAFIICFCKNTISCFIQVQFILSQAR